MKILIRADASIPIGTGHVMRCLALTQACLAAGWEVTFLIGEGSPLLAQRVKEEGVVVMEQPQPWGTLADAQQTIALADQIKADWAVVDGYHFGADYQKWLKEANLRVLVLDDYGHATHYWADIVLNQNITASQELYTSREPYTKLLLGTRYVLLRKEFWPWLSWQRQIPPVASKILVTLGGSDPDNVTLKVILALQKAAIENLEAVVIVGGSNPHYQKLLEAIKGWEGKINLLQNISNMPELMAWADMAITAGGTTCWEAAFMGLPSLIVSLANNQLETTKHFARISAVTDIGSAQNLSEISLLEDIKKYICNPVFRLNLSKAYSNIIDGEGCSRLIKFLLESSINLRSAREEDCLQVWTWFNDPQARENSFSSKPIPWQQHMKWFHEKMASKSCKIYIALNEKDRAIGMIRYDISHKKREAVVSVNLDANYRGKGYGSKIIETSSNIAFEELNIDRINAYIKPQNLQSINAFLKAGFNYKPISQSNHEGNLETPICLAKEK